MAGRNFQNQFMFSMVGSGEYFRKKSQISKHKKQTNPNCQKPNSKRKSVVKLACFGH